MKKKNPDICEVITINQKKVSSLRRGMEKEEVFLFLMETFKVLANNTRLKIIYLLSLEELCVCDLAHTLKMTISAISHQLRILREQRLVKYRKMGKIVFYSLDDKHIEKLFAQGLKHIKERG
jgi:DNA-binding transcriptional ArsR family regulator